MSNREIIIQGLLQKFCGGVMIRINGRYDIAFSSATLMSKIGAVWNSDEMICAEFECSGVTYSGFYEDQGDVIAKTSTGEIVL